MSFRRLTSVFTLGVFGLVLTGTALVLARDTIYVNTSGVDSRNDLSPAQKEALKQRILDKMREKFPAEDFDITNDPNQASGASREVKTDPGPHNPDDRYGEWTALSKSVTVFLGGFMDNQQRGPHFKDPNGNWDPNLLGNAVAETASHEIGHSYSVGHNQHNPPDIMTDGSQVPTSQRAADNRVFDDAAKEVLDQNVGKEPCKTATDYDVAPVESRSHSVVPGGEYANDEGWGPDEFPTDALLTITGYLPGYYFGYIGDAVGGGYQFVAKSSLDSQFHMPLLTWFQLAPIGRMSFAIAPQGGATWSHPDEMLFAGAVDYLGTTIYQELTLVWYNPSLAVALDAGFDLPDVYNGWVPLGACCRLDGTCQPLSGPDCASIGGLYHGDNYPCTPTLCTVVTPGDLNCDGVVNFDDINPFVLALSDPAAYQIAYPDCNILNADCDGDGDVDFDDINSFVAILSGA